MLGEHHTKMRASTYTKPLLGFTELLRIVTSTNSAFLGPEMGGNHGII